MKTNFFSLLSQYARHTDIQFNIYPEGEKLIVSIFTTPRVDDDAKNAIRPLRIKATVQELDENFFEKIYDPIKQVDEWAQSIQEFEKSIAEAEAASQRKQNELKELSENEKAAKELFEKATSLQEQNQLHKALEKIKKATQICPDNKDYKSLQKQLTDQLLGGSLFNSNSDNQQK